MKPRLLIVNVYFAPDSYGGATIVAEQLAWRLSSRWEILVVSTFFDPQLPPLHIVRYRVNQVEVAAVNLHPGSQRIDRFMNPYFACQFSTILDAFQPDAVHFHCIQGMGAEMLQACVLAGIPSAVTIHDNWWICERQFMINDEDRYCFQEEIDLAVCQRCMGKIKGIRPGVYGDTRHRFSYLCEKLLLAEKILFPSAFQKNLYEKNMKARQSRQFVLNRNGICPPSRSFARKPGPVPRFGFVGGIGSSIKGFSLVEQAFANLDPSLYQLVVVDNTLNLGYSSVKSGNISNSLNIKIVPAYTQETMDAFFAEVDVLLFPSQWKESFGLTVREALIRDIWVICTDGGGTVEDIVDGENGTVIPMDGNWIALREAVEQVLKKNMAEHVNPYKDRIITFDDQAEELHGILLGLQPVDQ